MNTTKTREAAAKKILKSNIRPELSVSYATEAGHMFCDGYRAVFLREYLGAFPPCPGGIGESITRFLFQARNNHGSSIDAPSKKELAEHIHAVNAEAKKERCRARFASLEIMPGVWCDARLLLDMLKMIDDARIISGDKPYSTLYIKGSNGEGILCPIRRG